MAAAENEKLAEQVSSERKRKERGTDRVGSEDKMAEQRERRLAVRERVALAEQREERRTEEGRDELQREKEEQAVQNQKQVGLAGESERRTEKGSENAGKGIGG